MTAFLHVVLPLASLLLSQVTSATAIEIQQHVDENAKMQRIVRRHAAETPTSVELGPSGALVADGTSHGRDRQRKLEDDERYHVVNGHKKGNKVNRDMCRDAFSYGKLDSNECSEEGHKLIFKEETCRAAAAEAGLGTNGSYGFKIVAADFDKHPKGCFKDLCNITDDPDPKRECAYFNEDGDIPSNPLGQGLCTSPRYANGTADTIGECPTGFEQITTLDACSIASDCMGYCETGGFEIGLEPGNETDRLKYPQGCFLDTSGKDGAEPCVYFNPPNDHKDGKRAGIPVCKAPNELTDLTEPEKKTE